MIRALEVVSKELFGFPAIISIKKRTSAMVQNYSVADTQDHDFRGFDEGGGCLPRL